MRAALIVVGLVAAAVGAIATAIVTRETWAVLAAIFAIGAFVILGRLATAYAEPKVPRRIRRLGPLPRDPGLRPPPDITGDPFRD